MDLLAELLLLPGDSHSTNWTSKYAVEVIVRYPKDHVVVIGSMLSMGDVLERTRTVGLGYESPVDPSHQPSKPFPASSRRKLLDDTECSVTGNARTVPRCQCRTLLVDRLGHLLVDRLATPS